MQIQQSTIPVRCRLADDSVADDSAKGATTPPASSLPASVRDLFADPRWRSSKAAETGAMTGEEADILLKIEVDKL